MPLYPSLQKYKFTHNQELNPLEEMMKGFMQSNNPLAKHKKKPQQQRPPREQKEEEHHQDQW